MSLQDLSPESLNELQILLGEKAADLFRICDQEEKGFVTKRDMQRLRGEIPLDPDQLEAVFDTLDGDENGYLTLEEFTRGFGNFLGLEGLSGDVDGERGGAEQKIEEEDDDLTKDVVAGPAGATCEIIDEEDEFNVVLSELGLIGVIDDDSALRDMWLGLKRTGNDPVLTNNFEQFLSKLSRDLNKRSTDQEHFEHVVRMRNAAQEQQLQRLYEEMESQIGAERKRMRQEEEMKEQKLRQELETTIQLKEQQFGEAMTRMRRLQDQLEEARDALPEVKEEKEALQRERDKLRQELERERILQREMQEHLEEMKSQSQFERKQRAKAALKLSENIAQEREHLVNELDLVRAINSKMLDDRDVMMESSQVATAHNNPLSKGGETAVDVEFDDEFFEEQQQQFRPQQKEPKLKRLHSLNLEKGRQREHQLDNISLHDELMGMGMGEDSGRGSGGSLAEASAPVVNVANTNLLIYGGGGLVQQQKKSPRHFDSVTSCPGPLSHGETDSFDDYYVNPLSKDQQQQSAEEAPSMPEMPERAFKVIFIGDSSVGKSSIISRFCSGNFRPGLKSTIGVDFQTRTISARKSEDGNVQRGPICMQCWDTAGQERYRSITRQYFRKVDAAVVVYDLTSEKSFVNSREWLDNALEAAGEDASLLILANKLDLDDGLRKVRESDGVQLALRYSSSFSEVSALDGTNVEKSLVEFAELLSKREDVQLEKALKLTLEQENDLKRKGASKKACCR